MREKRKKGDRYRFDYRSKTEFSRDIHEAHGIELAILEHWLDRIEHSCGTRPAYRNNGCGPDGSFLESKDVHTGADYDVDDYGLVEVKFAKPLLRKNLHLKVDQVRSYLKQDASILMAQGWETDSPTYVFMPAALLQSMIDDLQVVSWAGFGGKAAYRLAVDKFVWRSLK